MRMTASRVYTRPQPVPKMPSGMVELMEGLTREVLKNNPTDVYEFCANHMKKLLEIRDGPTPTSSKRVLTLEEKIDRVLQKSRQRAEQRRAKYDEAIKVKNEVDEKADSGSIQEAKALAGLVENLSVTESFVSDALDEGDLRTPVYREQELTDTMEVEIFHKLSTALNDDAELAAETEQPTKYEVNEEMVPIIEKFNDGEIVSGETIKSPDKECKSNGGGATKSDEEPEAASVDLISSVLMKDDELSIEKHTIDDSNIITEGTSEHNKELTNVKSEDHDNISKTNIESLEKTEALSDVPPSGDLEAIVVKSQDSVVAVEEPPVGPETLNKSLEDNSAESVIVNEIDNNKEKNSVENKADEFAENITDQSISPTDGALKNKTIDELLNDDNKSTENSSKDRNMSDITGIEFRNSAESKNVENLEMSTVEKTVQQNEVPRNPEDLVNNENSVDLGNSTTTAPNNNIHEADVKKKADAAMEDKKPEDTDSIHTENTDCTIKEEKVLLVEPAETKDDNTSVPVESIDFSTIKVPKRSSLETNNETASEYSITVSDTDLENLEPIQLMGNVANSEEPKIDLENISEGLENVSLNTDAGKSDNDTVNGKSSSMDDSAPEDCTDKTIESDDSRSNGKPNSNTNGMDLETAAVTIQKVFRTFLFKSRASTFDDSVNEDMNLTDEDIQKVDAEFLDPPSNVKERRGITRMDTVLQTVNEEKSLSLSTDDSSLSSAATIIQAHVRGFLVRNRLNSNKTISSGSANDNGISTSLEADVDQIKGNKTVLNIIVPEGGHFLSRDESVLTSIDLSLDGSPPSSVNLHPLGYDKSEPRKQLKRGDAIQSISPPSNNSGKLSEDVDSVKETLSYDSPTEQKLDIVQDDTESCETTPSKSTTIETVIETHKLSDVLDSLDDDLQGLQNATRRGTLTKMSSDENDVVTPFEKKSSTDSLNSSGLMHSGEFHDIVLPTKITRSNTAVVREFKNVLVYFLIWNNQF